MTALEGIAVIELARFGVSAYCTMLLGDLGAEVIKVEPPPDARGKIMGSGRSPGIGEHEAVAFQAVSRNKRSLVLDLKLEEAKQVFYQLSKKADVIVEGFRPGVVQRLGVDYQTISNINPRLIYCSITGYGQDGPYRELPGHDINYISVGGALSMIGQRGGSLAVPMNWIADLAGGSLLAVIAIEAAIIARQRTGKGQYLDVSMTDGVVSMMALPSAYYFSQGVIPRPGEHPVNGGKPYNNVYQTKDGKYISIGCIEPQFWENLCRALGKEELIPYQYLPPTPWQYTTGEKEEEVFSALSEAFLEKTRDEWFELLKDKNIAISKVCTLDETFSDLHVLHRNMVIEMEDPHLGKVKQVGIPLKFSDTPGEIRRRAPFLGEHTQEILSELGYSPEEIRELENKGAARGCK